MEDLWSCLEVQVKELINKYSQLKLSHHHLSQGQTLLGKEKELLLNKQKQVILQVESLITRLKMIEKSYD